MHRIVDCSGYTGLPDWGAVAKAGVEAVVVEATRGNDGANTLFRAQVEGARAAGLLVGAYHFAYVLPDSAAHPGRDPGSQVDRFWSVARPRLSVFSASRPLMYRAIVLSRHVMTM